MGRASLYGTLGNRHDLFAAKSDLSTFLDNLALVRPTRLDYVPRIWDMLFGGVPERTGPRVAQRRRSRGAGSEAMAEQRQNLLADDLSRR